MGWIYWGLYKKYYFYKTLAFLHVKVHAQRWVIQSGLCYHNQALVRNLISDIKKQIHAAELFFVYNQSYNLMTGCSKKNRENYPGKWFWPKERENPRPSNNRDRKISAQTWSQIFISFLSILRKNGNIICYK